MRTRLGFLGVGKMGSSILNGIVNSNLYQKEAILLYDVNETIRKKLKEKGYRVAKDEKEVVCECDYVLLAIKPQMLSEVLTKISECQHQPLYISIAAGISISYLQRICGKVKVVRAMPNTPAFISQAATAITKSKEVDEESFEDVKKIFSSIGIVREIAENFMDEIVPLNGSMPAYLYYFVQAFIEHAVKNNIDYEVSRDLACQAIIGSTNMILTTDKPIDQLINDVCSPKGTTLAGLEVLKKRDFQKIIGEACDACVNRAKELGQLKP